MDELSNIAAVNQSVVEKLHYLPLTDRLARELIPNAEERVEKMKECGACRGWIVRPKEEL